VHRFDAIVLGLIDMAVVQGNRHWSAQRLDRPQRLRKGYGLSGTKGDWRLVPAGQHEASGGGKGMLKSLADSFSIPPKRRRRLFQDPRQAIDVAVDGRQPVAPVAALMRLRAESDIAGKGILARDELRPCGPGGTICYP
jgi:hypothetical protein